MVMDMMKNRRKGFTLAEVLIAVAIIAVLAAVAFIAVTNHMRNMTKLEYDGYAKEIFVAAQNHLSMAESQGYLGGDKDYGEEDGRLNYFVVENGDKYGNGDSVLDMMLPFGAVDETLLGNSYIIRYHKDSGRVLDVFYWTENSGRFKLNYEDSDYSALLNLRSDENGLKNYKGAVVGYYGDVDPVNVKFGEVLIPPSIRVRNEEKLTVEVTDRNNGKGRLRLIVTGVTSGNQWEIVISGGIRDTNVEQSDSQYIVTLDDITQAGRHFANLAQGLIPGEDIRIQAVADSNDTEVLTNVARSSTQTTNSLFGYKLGHDTSVALVSNLRHLENLGTNVSSVNSTEHTSQLTIGTARQTVDLKWHDTGSLFDASVMVYDMAGNGTEAGGYLPLKPEYNLEYDGDGHTIAGVEVIDFATGAGMFGDVGASNALKVHDLKLIDFSVSGKDKAGVLAGTIDNGDIKNVVAYNSDDARKGVDGGAIAGGLVGEFIGEMARCSASVFVNAKAEAGGLIGKCVVNTTVVEWCYSGGHTQGGDYSDKDEDINVTGATAGGLVGAFEGATIANSYSTCSVSGTTAGGFVGTASIGQIANCYATGLVKGTKIGAFSGGAVVATGCSYYSIVNYKDGGGEDYDDYGYLRPEAGRDESDIAAFDANVTAYSAFVGETRGDADPYDSMLSRYYQNKYALKTVDQLGAGVKDGDFVKTHHGDWPSKMTFFVNNR